MNIDYIFNGEELTSQLRHVGHAAERELLLAFFELTGGVSLVDPRELKKLGHQPKAMWRVTRGWDPAVEPSWHHEYVCAFFGVELSGKGHVCAIKLKANGLVETLPGRMLKGLPGLKVLDLSDNDLRGGVPKEITFEAWPKLTHLILSDNPHLGGSLPACVPTTCRMLQEIRLHNCGLTGPLPPNLLNLLPDLKSFLLHDNSLDGPSPLALFTDEMLDKDRLRLGQSGSLLEGQTSGSAAGRVSLSASLAAAKEQASKSKESVAAQEQNMKTSKDHRHLVRVSCSDNKLSGAVGVLSVYLKLNLKHVSLGSNHLSGPAAPLLQRWSESTDQRCSLQSLSLDRNRLSGQFPDTLSTVRFTLQRLNLSHNQLTGPLDGGLLGQLAVLERLCLSHNHFTGLLPDSLSALSTSLQALYVGHNGLTGPLPCSALRHLTRLQTLDLQHNKLEGKVTDFFKRMSDLSELNLGFNALSGPMPFKQLGAFQQNKPPNRRLKVCVLQPNPRMIQPSEDEVANLRRDLPVSNLTVAWRNYTFT
mmetsp:Transcript_2054/g.4426  ORF Transcript_2054/g.4426 Transcript_2054/m.4426 type:complete len:532 (+) Transcript_2054:74-1669(+)